jgi:hypothetical protein
VEVDVTLRNLTFVALLALLMAFNPGCGSDGGGGAAGEGGAGGSAGDGGDGGGAGSESYAANICVGQKQAAAGAYCNAVSDAWASWASDQDDEARDASVEAATATLEASWGEAESAAEGAGASCAQHAWPASEAATEISAAVDAIAASLFDGLDLGVAEQATCATALVEALGVACEDILVAESEHVRDLGADSDGSTLTEATMDALASFSTAWDEATAESCPTTASEESVTDELQSVVVLAVTNTIVTPGLSADAFTAVEPGQTEYLGRTYEPQCMQGDQYRFFGKRGSVNKLVMYYMGGGACWNNFTCSAPTCTTSPPSDLEGLNSGFADFDNPDNPFRDWHYVFVSYCSCDIHYGDATQEYIGADNVTVEHKGFHNAKVAERWAREHFLNPEEVFVTGSSAGAYGAWFNAPLLHDVWPASQIHVLADAGNGVITESFLQNEFANWNFVANLPSDIPGVLESITEGNGMPGYTEAVATHFPDTTWAHYSTMFDGGTGGQTGFFNIMLNNDNPLAWPTWWAASCQFGETALAQSLDIYDTVPSNYRYYFGTGSRHTMWGSDKVYDDVTGNVPPIVSWIDGMLLSGPGVSHPAWVNVLCEDCGLLLDGDPRPDPLAPPFEADGDDVRIVCE